MCEPSTSSIFLTVIPTQRYSNYPHITEEETGSGRLSIEAKNLDVILSSSPSPQTLIINSSAICNTKIYLKSDLFFTLTQSSLSFLLWMLH